MDDTRTPNGPARAPLLWILLPAAAGLEAARNGFGSTSPFWAIAGLILAFGSAGAALSSSEDRSYRGWSVLLVGSIFLASIEYFHWSDRTPVRWNHLPPREARLSIAVVRVFNTRPSSLMITGIGRIVEAPSIIRHVAGQRIAFAIRRPNPESINAEILKSSQLRVRGVLEPLAWQGFDSGFNHYLHQIGVHFRFGDGRILSIRKPANAFQRFCHRAAISWEKTLRLGFPPDNSMASVYVAMLLGKKDDLSSRQKSIFARTGTMHLFAISGLHIGVVAFCLYCLLRALRMPEAATLLPGLSALFIFVVATGESPSAVRAFIMVSVFWIARVLSRPGNPFSALATAACVVLIVSPFELFSTGFQLSYGVVASILLYGLPLATLWQRRWQPWRGIPEGSMSLFARYSKKAGDAILVSLAISLAASLFSTPLVIQNFGIFAAGGVLTNLLAIPLASLTIVAGFTSLTCGCFGFDWLAGLFNHAAWLDLDGLVHLLRLEAPAASPHAHAAFRLPWIEPALLLCLVSILLVGRSRGWKSLPFGFFLPWIPWLGAIIFGVTFGS